MLNVVGGMVLIYIRCYKTCVLCGEMCAIPVFVVGANGRTCALFVGEKKDFECLILQYRS